MGVTGLNKHSVVKNINWQKGDLMDRLTGKKNGVGLEGTEKKMVSGNVKCFCLESQDKRIKLSKLMLVNFFPITIVFIFMILQIWTSVKEITLVT